MRSRTSRAARPPSSRPPSGKPSFSPTTPPRPEPGATSPISSAPVWPKLGALMDDAEADVLAYMAFPMRHRAELHSTNPLERLHEEIKRRADMESLIIASAD